MAPRPSLELCQPFACALAECCGRGDHQLAGPCLYLATSRALLNMHCIPSSPLCQAGLNAADEEIISWLRRTHPGKPLTLAVNKCDNVAKADLQVLWHAALRCAVLCWGVLCWVWTGLRCAGLGWGGLGWGGLGWAGLCCAGRLPYTRHPRCTAPDTLACCSGGEHLARLAMLEHLSAVAVLWLLERFGGAMSGWPACMPWRGVGASVAASQLLFCVACLPTGF